jgi:type I restriction enzyme S subunit
MKFGLSDKELEAILNAFRQVDAVEEVILFGSRAMNTYKSTSDIDLAIKGANVNLHTITSLKSVLEELPVIYQFDVVNFHKVDNPKFINHITRYGLRIYSKNKGQVNYFLKDVTTKIGSGATPRGGQEAYHAEGISLIRSQNVLDFDFSYNGLAFIDDDQADKLKNVTVKENDILLNITGDSVARVCKVPKEILPARVNQHVAIIRVNPKKLHHNYLLYYLLNPPFKKYMLKIASDGATRNAITKLDIEEFEISAPEDVNDQKEIVDILRTLDNKINLLKRQNQTLEELTQILFKRWFVDFEFPNEQGQPYKSSGGKMVPSELGEIPEGWRLGSLGEIMNNYDSKRIPLASNERVERKGIYPYYGAASVMDYIDDYIFDGRFVLLGEDGTVIDELGHPILQFVEGKIWVNNHAHVLEGKGVFSTEFLYFILRKLKVSNIVTGAVQPKINQGNLNSLEILIPQETILKKFNSFVKTTIDNFFNNKAEIQTLTQLRNTLLPKLMSGELTLN